VQYAAVAAFDLLEHELLTLTDNAYDLTTQQRGVLSGLRRRISDSAFGRQIEHHTDVGPRTSG
jgi:hypothetical protein